jgi:hypothetical protein
MLTVWTLDVQIANVTGAEPQDSSITRSDNGLTYAPLFLQHLLISIDGYLQDQSCMISYSVLYTHKIILFPGEFQASDTSIFGQPRDNFESLPVIMLTLLFGISEERVSRPCSCDASMFE